MDLSQLLLKNRRFHVITVHGIAPCLRSNATGDNDGNRLGALDCFAQTCYGATRTTNFTYTVQPYYDVPLTAIHDAAIDLLKKVKLKVESEESVPSLVFIGEDLGGIIIKQALLVSLRDEQYSSVVDKAILLVFVGTPHRATRLESWEMIAAKLALRGPHAVTHPLPAVVDRSARVLTTISQKFQAVSAFCNIISFYNPVVSSASLEFSVDTSLMRSQNEVAKAMVNSPDSTSVTLGNPQEFVQMTEMEMARTLAIKRRRLSFLRVLSKLSSAESPAGTECLDLDYVEIFNWLFDSSEYQQWLEGSKTVLWLRGFLELEMPALSYAVQSKLTATEGTSVIKFSCQGDDRYRSIRNMLASLSYQLLMLKPFLFSRVQALCDMTEKEESWGLDLLWTLFRALLVAPELGNIVCLALMIDRCDDTPDWFLEELFDLPFQPDCSFKLVVTSFKTSEKSTWGGVPMDLVVSPAQTDDQAKKRMKLLIGREISQLILIRPELRKFEKIITDSVNFAPDFQAVLVALRLLQSQRPRSSLSDIKHGFKSILSPDPFPEVSDYFLDKMPTDRDVWSQRALSWITLARRPLKLTELAVTLALQDEEFPSATAMDRTVEDLAADLQSTLGNLVAIRNGEAALFDGFLREYLLTSGKSHKITLLNDATMAETCLKYLTLIAGDKKHQSLLGGEQHHLFEYAVQYWAKHYNLAHENSSSELRSRALQFLEDYWPVLRNDPSPRNVLCEAVSLGFVDVVKQILDTRSPDHTIDNMALDIAIEKGYEEIVDSLCDAGADSPLKLHIAARHGREQLLDKLLTSEKQLKSAGNGEKTDFQGQTALHLAAVSGNFRIVVKLLDAEFDKDARDNSDKTPLHLASQFGHLRVVEELLRRNADTAVKDENGWAPFHVACKWQHREIAMKLLDRAVQAGRVNDVTSNEQTALYLASEIGCEDITGAIIDRMSSDEIAFAVTHQDNEGSTPLHIAARHGYAKVVSHLLLKGASQALRATALRDEAKKTPLHLAIQNGNYDVVIELTQLRKITTEAEKLEADAPDSKTSLKTEDDSGRLPIHLAIWSGDSRVVKRICELHSQFGESIEVFDGESKSPLHIAAQNGLTDIAEILLDNGAAADIGDDKFRTPLLLACMNDHVSTMALLLRRGADPMYTDSNGRSALHDAVEFRTKSTVSELLEISRAVTSESDFIRIRDNEGNTALHLAAIRGDVEIMEALLSPVIVQNCLQDRDMQGRSLLNLALDQNRLDMLKFLIHVIKTQASDESMTERWADLSVVKTFLEAMPHQTKLDINSEPGYSFQKSFSELLEHLADFGPWNDEEYGPVLRLAAEKGVKEIVEKLVELLRIESGSDDDDDLNQRMQDALSWAARSGQTDVVEFLLEDSDDDKRERENLSLALILAAKHGHLSLLSRLASKYHSRINQEMYGAALKIASSNGETEIVEFLLKEIHGTNSDDSDIVRSLNDILRNVLKSGAGFKMISLLLSYGADLDSAIDSWSTPLHTATGKKDIDVCRLILERKRSYLNMKDYEGRTAIYIAAFRGDLHLVNMFIDDFQADIEAANSDGWRPIHAAYDSPSIVEKLLDAKAEIDAATNHGQTALLLALQNGYRETAKHLIRKGADPCIANISGDTPLHVLSRSRYSEDALENLIKDMLGKTKRSVDVRNDEGETPLSLAASAGKQTIVRMLLARDDVDINQSNNEGRSPLGQAIRNNRLEVARLLSENPKLNLDLALPSKLSDDLLRYLMAKNHCSEVLQFLLTDKPEICDRFGDDVLFDAIMSAEELIETNAELAVLGSRIETRRDEHGWSVSWLRYAGFPASHPLIGLPPETAGYQFQRPSRWQNQDSTSLLISEGSDGLVLSFTTPRQGWYYNWTKLILADHPIPPIGTFTLEIEVIDEGENAMIGIGFGTKFASTGRMPGWRKRCWGYHGNDGKIYHNAAEGTPYGPTYGKGDKIGCHIDMSARTAHFTKNEENLGIAFRNLQGRLYPMVGTISPGMRVSTKFTWHQEPESSTR